MSNSCFSTFSWLADCKASAIAKGSIGKMNAVFPPWPIREFRDRSDGIPESGRVRTVSFGVQGRFFPSPPPVSTAEPCGHRNTAEEQNPRPRNYMWAQLMARVFALD